MCGKGEGREGCGAMIQTGCLSAPSGMPSGYGPTAGFGEDPQSGSGPDNQKVDAKA